MQTDDLDDFWELLAGSVKPRHTTAPPPGHAHITEDELVALAAYDGGSLGEQERLNFRRALECSNCYTRLARLRHVLIYPEKHGITVAPISAEEVRKRASRAQLVRALRIQITQEWLTAMLAAAAKSRIRIRGAVRTRGGTQNSRVPTPDEAPLVIETADLVVTVTAERAERDNRVEAIAADDFAGAALEQRFNVVVRATPKTADASTKGLLARLRKRDDTTLEQPFEGHAQVSFSGLTLDSYELELLPSL